jgi:hypothetical protein
MQQINEEQNDEEEDEKCESEKRANLPQAGSSDSEVPFWWPHEGKNNDIHDIVGPSKLFRKNELPYTNIPLLCMLSY